MGKYQKNIEAARRISVVQYLETYHPGELVRKTDKEYCTKTHSSLVITPANGLFHWFSQSKGGNNALDYLVKVEGMDFVSAVRLLNEMTPMPVSVQTVKAAPVQQQTSRPFVLPPADRNTEAATAYLMHRGVSPKVLRYCVGSGILYQTTRGSYRNCVFVGKDENGVPRSAFQRGCQGSFRGDVAGSQKQYGFLIPAESENCDTVEIYEAPIDAMSGATLRQYKHDSPWRSVHYLALGGLNHQPIDYFLQQHPEVKRVSLCFDRDDPGRNFTKIVAKQLAERGYIVQDTPPAIGKDYNDYLLAARRLISITKSGTIDGGTWNISPADKQTVTTAGHTNDDNFQNNGGAASASWTLHYSVSKTTDSRNGRVGPYTTQDEADAAADSARDAAIAELQGEAQRMVDNAVASAKAELANIKFRYEEVGVPYGFAMYWGSNGSKQTISVSANSNNAYLMKNNEWSLQVNLKKTDSETGNQIAADAQYEIFQWDTVTGKPFSF